jgi:23S rRNA (adenine-N6)-dimethyltransferase
LAAGLRGRWSNVTVVVGDAANLALPRKPFRVVASLSFHATTGILRHLLDDPCTSLRRADVIVEWGVALKRSLPWPSTLNDVLWGAWYEFTLVRRLPAAVFEPRPRVDAGVLTIERRARGLQRLGVPRATPRELDAHQWAALFNEQ